jgi:TonB family protein
LLVAGFRSPAQAPGHSNLNELAIHAAATIRTESKRSLGPTRVLVVDFTELPDKPTELGRQLAEEFSASLKKQSHLVDDRGESLRAVAGDRLLSGSLEGPDVTRCYDNEVGSAVVVEGEIDSVAGQFSLGTRAWRIADRKTIFEERIMLTLTDRMRAAHLTAASHSDVAPLMSQDVALNYEHMQGVEGVPGAGTRGYSLPSCIYCPGVLYSKAASKAKIQGRVLLSAVIAAEGAATRISIIRGLPCGLKQQAINSVAQWRFKPTTDPEGRPAAVRQTIEVTFHVR